MLLCPKGSTGLIGVRCVKGVCGVAGPDGPKGPSGEKGDRGWEGPPGRSGRSPVGDQGEQGERGQHGERVEKGIQGDASDVLSVLATHLPIQLAERYGEKMCSVKYHVSEDQSSIVRLVVCKRCVMLVHTTSPHGILMLNLSISKDMQRQMCRKLQGMDTFWR